ncbi:NlpC/P60 family protein [Allokutzneria sp. NRRL B-24872]|uniref:C40 family peptidase n=1 Tax=Allokutzneria sp. NRRL B-24872 TaxID=1137961 RepID=UPI000A388ED2|nr:C40 family peptidase [Allokutzneria sp. NRRL B-24872]
MASNRLKRTMRGALTAGAVAVAVSMVPVTPAVADPDTPANASEALKQLKALSEEAEKLTEELHKANDDLKAKEGEVTKANEELTKANAAGELAKQQEGELRGRVDQLASSNFQGTRVNHISALLLSRSPNEFLDKLSMVDLITSESKDSLDKLNATINQAKTAARLADEAKAKAATAATESARIKGELENRKKEAAKKQEKAQQALDRLSLAEKKKLEDAGLDIDLSDLPDGGLGTAALKHAVTQKGKPYVWGAEGPNSYDCSGLTSWAYSKVGVKLPRSSAQQARVGSAVPVGNRDAWKPGDLLFFGSRGIHHVALYAGNGMQFHASTSGQPLKYDKVQSDLVSVRRMG